ncbi:MAG TPA: hypothetical protein VK031_09485, partial [Tissierellaceae bacterium]|nr:hypothetical protein [Tissierellaceae bacterium]
NWVQNRQDRAISYIFQKGIPEWDESTEYIAGKSFIQHEGSLYRASTTNTGKRPDESPNDWDVVFS